MPVKVAKYKESLKTRAIVTLVVANKNKT